MIIKFDEQFEENIKANPNQDDTIKKKINNLFAAMENENLFIKASLSFLYFLKNNWFGEFSKWARRCVQTLITFNTQIMSEVKNKEPLITISDKNPRDCSLSGSCVCSIYDIPDVFEAKMFCENIDDGLLFKKLYKELRKNDALLQISELSFCGSNINCIETELNRNSIFITIADSDKRYPNADEGTTASKIRELYQTHSHLFSTFYILNVHEKENLIPTALLKDCARFTSEQKTMLEIVCSSNDDVKNFFDIKDGLTKEKQNEYKNDADYNAFYNPIIQEAKNRSIFFENNNHLIRGIKSCGISQVLDEIDYNSFNSFLTPEQKTDLDSIFDQMFRFGFRFINKRIYS